MNYKLDDMNVTLAGSKLSVYFDQDPESRSVYIPGTYRPRFVHALKRLKRNPEYFFQALHELELETGETLNEK